MKNNFAFIDSQNLNLSIRDQWWKLDWKKFRIYLKNKFKVKKAYLFIGFKEWNQKLYTYLQECWYICIFKPTLELSDWTVKWNVDAELVLHTMIQYNTFDKAIIISWDGDFYCLVEYLEDNNKLERLLVPNEKAFSSLLRKFIKKIFYLSRSNLRKKIWYFK